MSKIKVAFIHNVHASWVDRDLDLLHNSFEVHDFYFVKFSNSLNWFDLKEMFSCDVFYFWFGSLNFLPLIFLGKILRKKIVIVSGGYDVARVPHINYGAFLGHPILNQLRVLLFKLADRVICISGSNLKDTISLAKADPKKCQKIYHGFSFPKREINSWDKRKNRVLLLARANKDTFDLKGIGYFLKLAKKLPDYEFFLLGEADKYTKDIIQIEQLKNFTATGFLDYGSLKFDNLINESKFILMLSQYESFGCALADGALLGAYPISFDHFGQTEVNEGIGSIVSNEDIDEVAKIIISKTSESIKPKDISLKMKTKFPIEVREKKIIEVIQEVML